MRKTRDLFKTIRNTEGTFHAKMGKMKDKKRYEPNRSRRNQDDVARITEKLNKKILMTQIIMTVLSLTRAKYPGV